MSKTPRIPEKYHARNLTYYRAVLAGPFRITGVKSMPGLEGEAWRGQITEHGKPIGEAHDDGNGGPLRIRTTNAAADARLRAWAKNLPPEPMLLGEFDEGELGESRESSPFSDESKLEMALSSLSDFASIASSRAKNRKAAIIEGDIVEFRVREGETDAAFEAWLSKTHPGAWAIPKSLLLAPVPPTESSGTVKG